MTGVGLRALSSAVGVWLTCFGGSKPSAASLPLGSTNSRRGRRHCYTAFRPISLPPSGTLLRHCRSPPPPNVSLEQILVETLNNGANHSAGRIERLSKPCEGVATVFNVYAREEQRYAHIISTPFRTAVPFWGQFTYNLSTLSPHIYGTAVLKGLRGDHP